MSLIGKLKKNVKHSLAANAAIRKKAKAEYFRAKEKESLREARQKAKIETNNRLKQYKQKGSSGGIGFKPDFSGFMPQQTSSSRPKLKKKYDDPFKDFR